MQKQLQEERLQRAQARAQAEIKKKVGRVAPGSHLPGEGPHDQAQWGWEGLGACNQAWLTPFAGTNC